MNKIAAFDLSLTASGWACYDHGTVTDGVIRFPKMVKTPVARLTAIGEAVADIALRSDVVLIEGYAYGRTNRAHGMGELGGVVRVYMLLHGLRLVVVPPTVIKKFATGKGNAGKGDMLVSAVRRLGLETGNHNIADAQWLLAMGMCKYGLEGAPAMPKAQMDVLEKVDWEGVR